jgi:hypothetical protein
MKLRFGLPLVILALSLTAFAGDLTFITKATRNDKHYKAYIDLSTKHLEGTYQTVTLYSYYDTPISADGYSGIQWMKNTFQTDCKRNVKRVTYIAYLDSQGKTIVDQTIKDAPDEGFGNGTVDNLIKPYLCQ